MTGEATPEQVQQAGESILGLLNGFMTAASLGQGLEAGLIDALADGEAVSTEELADRLGLHERWVREWVHQQTAGGVLESDGDGRFLMSAGTAAVLTNTELPTAWFLRSLPPILAALEHLPEAMRTGIGRPYESLGSTVFAEAEARSRPMIKVLLEEALPALSGVTTRLEAGGEVADVGCGTGYKTVAMAEAFPRSRFRGYDNSRNALAVAEQARDTSELSNVTFHDSDTEGLPEDHSLDFVTFFDVVHDLHSPTAMLRRVRHALKPDGTVLVVDVQQPEELSEKLRLPHAPMVYGLSMAVCMSSSMSVEDGEGLGTLGLHASRLREIAADAGFTHFRQTDVTDQFNAYYELRP